MSLSKVLPFIKQIPADLIGFHISGVGQHNRTCSLANRLIYSREFSHY